MLSNAAFNALLKTLEEPPPHLVFILATTDPHKMPETVLSRCQHFALRRLSRQEIVTQLARVMQQKGAAFTEAGLGLIARASGGSMRDALTLLDQAVVYAGEGEGSGITEERLFALLGRMGAGRFPSLARAIQGRDAVAALSLAREISERGYDLRQFLTDWMEHLRNLIVARQVPGAEAWMDLPPEEITEIQALSVLFSPEALQRLFALFSRLQEEIRNAQDAHLLFEVALMKAILLSDLQPIETVIQRLEALEGAPRAATTPQAPSSSAQSAPYAALDKAAPSAYIPPIPPVSPTPPIRPRPPRKVGVIPSHETFSDWVAQVRTTRPSIASYLETGTLVSVDPQKMTLGFSQDAAFVIALLQNGDNKRWLTDAVASYFQNGVILELATAPKAPVLPHPLVQEALSIFGGAVMAVPQGESA
jgi:DNA polymerase-3 subunit gamma/tau